MKTCIHCGGEKAPGRGRKTCDPCQAKFTKHHHDMVRKYGITAEQYEQLLEWQGGRCAICGNRPRKKRLAVDHDHRTGEVRGLLCATFCNHKMLGGARENPEILRRAADYLEDPPFPLMLRFGGDADTTDNLPDSG